VFSSSSSESYSSELVEKSSTFMSETDDDEYPSVFDVCLNVISLPFIGIAYGASEYSLSPSSSSITSSSSSSSLSA